MGTKTIGPQTEATGGLKGGLLTQPGYATSQWLAGQAPTGTQMGGEGAEVPTQDAYNWGQINNADLPLIGWTGQNNQYGLPYQLVDDSSQIGGPSGQMNQGQGALTPEFQQYLASKGITLRTGHGESGYASQFYGPDGQPIGQGQKYGGPSEGDIFGISTLAAGGLMGGAAAGLGATAGEGAGLGSAFGGVPAGGTFVSDAAALPEVAGSAGVMEGGAAAGGAAAGAGGGGAAGGLMGAVQGLLPAGTNLGQIAQLAGVAGTLYSAVSANNANQSAISAQSNAAAGQLGLAQDQWNFFKNIYLPKSLDLATQQQDLATKVANQQLDDAAYYRGVSQQAVTQAQKSYAFQDQYMDLANKYASGQMANTLADEAGADVQQAGALQRGITERDMERRGVNPNSGAGMALQNDNQIAQAAANAGAQTQARRMARDKAESMIATAAGAGQAGFGTGLQAGSLAMGNNNAAVANQQTASNTLNSAGQTYGYGTAQAGNSYYGGGRTGVGLSSSYAGSPFADAISGIFKGSVGAGTTGSSGTSPYDNSGLVYNNTLGPSNSSGNYYSSGGPG